VSVGGDTDNIIKSESSLDPWKIKFSSRFLAGPWNLASPQQVARTKNEIFFVLFTWSVEFGKSSRFLPGPWNLASSRQVARTNLSVENEIIFMYLK
jgi:hypothetical protein